MSRPVRKASSKKPGKQHVQVIYVSSAGKVHTATVHIEAGASVGYAISHCGILQSCPEIDLEKNRTGIFGKLCTLEDLPADGDRIEIYRPLPVDPKEMRRRVQQRQESDVSAADK